MARAKQPVSIDGMEFDALISEDHTFEASVPEYSVEEGYTVSDTIILGQERLSMVLFLTELPVTWSGRHSGSGRVRDIVQRLKDKYYEKTPVTVVTTDETYTNMAIESITLSKNVETGYAKEIPISFRKIRTTATRTTSIPSEYRRSGATAANAGTASTSAGNAGGSVAQAVAAASAGSGGSSGSSGSSGSNASSGTGNKASILYSIGKSVGLIR